MILIEMGYGFSRFKSYNLAMLGKQLWRIINNPTSLLNRDLRPSTLMIVISLSPPRKVILIILGKV